MFDVTVICATLSAPSGESQMDHVSFVCLFFINYVK
jgi:hypothetical protein